MKHIDVVRIWEYKVGEDAYIKEQWSLIHWICINYILGWI